MTYHHQMAESSLGNSSLSSFGKLFSCVVCSLVASLAQADLRAENSSPDALTLLENHCVKCHGGEKTKGGLDLVTREALMRGGESGAAVVAGKPDESLLVQSIRHDKDPHMPHKESKLSDATIAQLVEWVKAGAPYSRPLNKAAGGSSKTAVEFTVTEADRKHWAFRPIKRPTPPSVNGEAAAIANPVDQFILAKLQPNQLAFSPRASKEQLIRRVAFDLVGLPPTPKEIDAFVNDASPKAYENLIDRLLASPHYGERWGRHWLDLARYAETDGFEHDAVRPHSWRYRDYVIKSFNADKPYDRFIREQLAGDELWPDDPDAVTATGFNLLGPDMVDSSDQVQRRHNTLNDMTDTTALAFLGLTMGCARCHDHKFEPLSQRDYYSLQAFFTPAKFVREKPIPSPDARIEYEAALKKYNEHPKVRELAALEAPVREKLFQRKVAKLSPEAQVAHKTPAEKRDAEQANLVLETEDKVKISDKELASAFSGAEKERRRELLDELKHVPKPPSLPKAMALAGGDASVKTFVLNRGEYSQPGDEVSPRFPSVLPVAASRVPGNSSAAVPASRSSRAALADWIASTDNPLTARVMVNRIWQHHFGRGLVASPSDFGTHGQAPSHPELLDWLASEFIARGWSLKQMHKLMLMSARYQQSSVASPAARAADPDNKLYSRMNRLRLEGEVIRDSLLAISGQLNPQMSGPGVFPPVPKELFAGAKGGWPQNDRVSEYSRRSVYIFARRNLRFPFLEVFDAPDNNLSCPARERSTTAPQSLTLLNAEEVTTASKATAKLLAKDGRPVEEQIVLVYRLTLGRAPTSKEQALAREFLAQSPMNEFCRALFNLNDFVYLE